jgi:transcriptional regulator with XRE-family HTH domain
MSAKSLFSENHDRRGSEERSPMAGKKKIPSAESLTLLYMRSRRGWRQQDLSDRMGLYDPAVISRYERGDNQLFYEKLLSFAAVLEYPPATVDTLLSLHGWLQPLKPAELSSPVDLTPAEQGSLERSVLAATTAFREVTSKELARRKRERKADAARLRARELWPLLKAAPRQDQRELVMALPAFQDWALAVHVCEASVRAAAHKPDEALHLADLAVLIATRSPGAEGWRSRLEGFCWAHLANARRVANDFAGADKAFARAWELWKAGTVSAPDLLPEWRMLDLEASLRRAERRFLEALELLDRAKEAIDKENPLAIARILLKREHVFDQMGEIGKALETLWEAKPFVEASGDPRFLFALLFNTVDNLCQLKQYEQAANQLTQVREAAIKQGNELDLVRVVWLEARIKAGQGQSDEAVASLEKVRQDFTARELPYDAALASLDLAVLWLEAGRSAEVRNLTRAMAWIFQAQGISREALAALVLFRDAAQRETATVELVQRVISEVKAAKRSAPHPSSGQRGRG